MRGKDDVTKSAFYYGLGIMGVLAGFGFGSKSSNKLALLIGAGSLYYANHLNPVVDISARPELQQSVEDLKRQIPAMPKIPSFSGLNGCGVGRCH